MNEFINLLPIFLVFVIFYLVLYLPQRRRAKKHDEFIENLKIGDDVMTDSGILGRVIAIDEKTATLVLKKGEIKIQKAYIKNIS
jgi:preprotein translocase subunit YajC|tara:strand:- start:1512 stop:1763 length:252 start_codon:yes stop_codon:yes gene_type:complete